MFQNFLKITLRALMKSKVFVFINLIGLGLALACCIVAFLNYEFAMTFDQQHENYDELYKVSIYRDQNAANVPYGFAPMVVGDVIKDEIPSITRVSKFQRSYTTIKRENNVFNRMLAFVDEDFMDMFSFKVLFGNAKSYQELSTVLISDRVAIALFGRVNAVGETVEFVRNGQDNLFLTVGGVFEEPGLQSTMQFQLVADFENYYRLFNVNRNDWTQFIDGVFIQTTDESISEKVPQFLQKYASMQAESREDFQVSGFWVQPMEDLPFNERDLNGSNLGNSGMHPQHITAPNIMALLILLLACFNFTNTAIAMSNKRLKEIGIRKTVGGSRKQLIIQFLGENIFLCFLALILGLLFSLWLVPKYNGMWPNVDVAVSLIENPKLVLFLLSVLFATGLLAGGYPAFFVSRYKPVEILRGTLRVGSSSILSRILLGLQMFISVLALVFGFSFYQNSVFQEELDLGYDKEGVMMIPLANPSEAQRFKAAVETNPNIQQVSMTNNHIGWGSYGRAVRSGEEEYEVSVFDIGMNYVETMGFNIVEGRSFNRDNRQQDEANGILINERFASQFGWTDPVGQRITIQDTLSLTVVGMMEDFYTWGFFGSIGPTMFRLKDDQNLNVLVVKVPEAQVGGMIDYMEDTWMELIPDRPTNVNTHEENVMAEAKDINSSILVMFLFLAVIAVVLSAIGLFTLVSINIQSRIKEIGIRKVLGASVVRITTLINRPFLIIVGIASVVGAILGTFLAGGLMGTIWRYHVMPSMISGLVPVLIILIIALSSISGKVVKAARRNPVDSLRYE
jgi:putative ABC transport system permease protein